MVIIILGSSSDKARGENIGRNLTAFGIDYKTHIASAHKTPAYLLKILQKYETKFSLVYICVAGRSNALGGFVDAATTHPVINCPPSSEKFGGLDVLSSLRMPSGVAPVTVLEPEQAALAAAKILAVGDKELKRKIAEYQERNREKIIGEKLII